MTALKTIQIAEGDDGTFDTATEMLRLIDWGASEQSVRDTAAYLTSDSQSREEAIFELHAFVRDEIEYQTDESALAELADSRLPGGMNELLRSAEITLDERRGDCDCQAVLLGALIEAADLGPVALAVLKAEGSDEFSHVLSTVETDAGKTIPLETIVPGHPAGVLPDGMGYTAIVRRARDVEDQHPFDVASNPLEPQTPTALPGVTAKKVPAESYCPFRTARAKRFFCAEVAEREQSAMGFPKIRIKVPRPIKILAGQVGSAISDGARAVSEAAKDAERWARKLVVDPLTGVLRPIEIPLDQLLSPALKAAEIAADASFWARMEAKQAAEGFIDVGQGVVNTVADVGNMADGILDLNIGEGAFGLPDPRLSKDAVLIAAGVILMPYTGGTSLALVAGGVAGLGDELFQVVDTINENTTEIIGTPIIPTSAEEYRDLTSWVANNVPLPPGVNDALLTAVDAYDALREADHLYQFLQDVKEQNPEDLGFFPDVPAPTQAESTRSTTKTQPEEVPACAFLGMPCWLAITLGVAVVGGIGFTTWRILK